MGHNDAEHGINIKGKNSISDDFVLEKSIFNNIFDKDIKRVFMYKKAERLAKAIHLIAPAFAGSVSLRVRMDAIAVALVDAAILPPGIARTALSHELLTLSSVLAIARTSGLLSPMNADLMMREAHFLLQEVAAYEEPRLALEDVPTLSEIAKQTTKSSTAQTAPTLPAPVRTPRRVLKTGVPVDKGHIKDRQEAVLSVIRAKGKVSIKDISHLVRGVSEKTVQRELASLVEAGVVTKEGERRWSIYSLR